MCDKFNALTSIKNKCRYMNHFEEKQGCLTFWAKNLRNNLLVTNL